MKTQVQQKNLKSWAFWSISLVFVISSSLVGCGDDGDTAKARDDGRRGRNEGRIDPTKSDEGYDDLLVTGLAVSTDGSAEMAVEIFTPNGEDRYANYSGAVDVFGYLEYQGPDFPECGFRPGYYELRTDGGPNGFYSNEPSAVFNWQDTVLEGVRDGSNDRVRIVIPSVVYDAFGNPTPTGIEFTQSQTQIGLDGYSYSYDFWGEIIIESYKGRECYVGFGASEDFRRIFFSQPAIF